MMAGMMERLRTALALRVVTIALSSVAPATARADEPNLTSARSAYDEGAAAYDSADYARACEAFDRADALAPNVTVLKLALTSCVRSDDAVRSMNLVERARGRDVVRELAETATTRFVPRLARVGVQCNGASPCSATLDGTPVAPSSVRWVSPGPHVVELTTGRGAEKRALWLVAGEYQLVTPAKPSEAGGASITKESRPALAATQPPTRESPPPRPPPQARVDAVPSGGVSPAWFWAGVATTALLGGASVASGLDTLGRHDTFVDNRTGASANDGLDAQRRTNVLLVGTGAAALVTAVVGVFVVRWSTQSNTQAARR